ncbi:MAG TPA: DUF4296 domain-containing protein [Flavisolibacter sp.]|jgi:hypothetical protein|nr:DUF4296 domain-containing protein [Flavisolibacter sp.]
MRTLGILVIVILIFSCKLSVPKDVLPPKKMQAVLWDVMQADEIAEYYSVKDSTFHSLPKHAEYYQKVFSMHKITKEDFKKSLAYYESHPVVFKAVLDSLKSFGEKIQRADSLKTSKSPVIDSATKRIDSFKKKPLLPIKHH